MLCESAGVDIRLSTWGEGIVTPTEYQILGPIAQLVRAEDS